mgnify:FL=1
MSDTTNPNDPKWMAFVAWAQRRWGSREAWHHTINTCGEWDAWNGALEQQAAQIESLRADAERYRWLRRTTNAVTSKGERIDVRNNPDLWDAAIDAALRQEASNG